MRRTPPRHLPTRLALTLPAVVLATTALAAPARADAPDQACWTDLDTGAVTCFDASLDPATAIAELTGRPVVAEPNEPGSGVAARPQGTAGVQEVYLLVTVYDDTSFGGASMTYSTSNSSICASAYGFPSLGDWNDRIESYQGYNACNSYLYRDINYGTLIYGPINTAANIGAARNQASSLIIG